LMDRFLNDAKEVDVDAISDGKRVTICGILEHIEEAGIHSGDSTMVLPPHSLSNNILEEIKDKTRDIALKIKVKGFLNIQFAIKDEKLYIIEVNPRASRTIPFISKAIGVPLAKLSARIMAGKTLDELQIPDDFKIDHFCVKESVFPFIKFPNVDTILGPEMKSTGEVMGIDKDLKAQDVVKRISLKYFDRLNYYSSLEVFNQYNLGEEVISDIERYRNLIETVLVFDESEIIVDEIKRFISSSEKFNFIYGEFDYYMSVSDFIVSLVKSNELEYSKQIIDKIEDLLIRRVSVFSNLDEDEQIFYIEGITSDINNYSKIINSIELFNSELYDNYKKNLDELLNNIVE